MDLPWRRGRGDAAEATCIVRLGNNVGIARRHWQSIALWYSAKQVGQRGPVTRIASGCSDAEVDKVRAEWREIDPTGTFRAHFAPAGELRGGSYKYSNKPSGLYHWLTTASPPPFKDWSRGVVALLDPDQLLMRPITAAVGAGLSAGAARGEFVDAAGTPRVLDSLGAARSTNPMAAVVAPGFPAGQQYVCRADIPRTGSRHRRGRDVAIPWRRVAATPRGSSEGTTSGRGRACSRGEVNR